MKIPWLEVFLVVGVALFAGGLADRHDYQDASPGLIGLGAACLTGGGLAYDARRRRPAPYCPRCAERNMADILAAGEARRKLHGPRPPADAVRGGR